MNRWARALLLAAVPIGAAAALAVPLVPALVVQPYRIPQASMVPTLRPGSYVLAWKLGATPARGDLLVFRRPDDPSLVYVKRVVAVGGDRVEVRDDGVVLDGVPAPRVALGAVIFHDARCRPARANRYATRAGDVDHDVLIGRRLGPLANRPEITVPSGHFFVLGDNRDNSEDSRAWGTVPPEAVIGVATRASEGPGCP